MNIFEIKQELQTIFDELEENGGELTPELAEQLLIKQEEFKDKVEAYTNAIKLLEGDVALIKNEQKRLKELVDRKQKTIDKLKDIILLAVDQFGEVNRNNVKFLDYGTGQVSIRRSKAVDVDSHVLETIGTCIVSTMDNERTNNQLDVIDHLDVTNLINSIALDYQDENNNLIVGSTVTEDDLNHTQIKLTAKVPMSKLLNGESYPVLREIVKHSPTYDIEATVVKSEIKKELEENGACAPNLARLVTNKSIQIK